MAYFQSASGLIRPGIAAVAFDHAFDALGVRKQLRIRSVIATDGGSGKDVFVHISAVEKAGLRDLREGAKVTYNIVANKGKESAENLRVS